MRIYIAYDERAETQGTDEVAVLDIVEAENLPQALEQLYKFDYPFCVFSYEDATPNAKEGHLRDERFETTVRKETN